MMRAAIIRDTMLFSLAVLVGVLASGCATPSTLLMNQQGQVIRCASSGWGYVGAPMAQLSHDRCVSDYKKLGYLELPDVRLGFVPEYLDTSIVVKSIVPGSPAQRVGLQAGDRIKTMDGTIVQTHRDLSTVLSAKRPGDQLIVVVERDGAVLEFAPIVEKR